MNSVPAQHRALPIFEYVPPDDPAVYPIPLVRRPSLSRAASSDHLWSSSASTSSDPGMARGLKALWKRWRDKTHIEPHDKPLLEREQGREDNEWRENGKWMQGKDTAAQGLSKAPPADCSEIIPSTMPRAKTYLKGWMVPKSEAAELKQGPVGKKKDVTKAQRAPATKVVVEKEAVKGRNHDIVNRHNQTHVPPATCDYSHFGLPLVNVSPTSDELYIPMPRARRQFLEPEVEVKELWLTNAGGNSKDEEEIFEDEDEDVEEKTKDEDEDVEKKTMDGELEDGWLQRQSYARGSWTSTDEVSSLGRRYSGGSNNFNDDPHLDHLPSPPHNHDADYSPTHSPALHLHSHNSIFHPNPQSNTFAARKLYLHALTLSSSGSASDPNLACLRDTAPSPTLSSLSSHGSDTTSSPHWSPVESRTPSPDHITVSAQRRSHIRSLLASQRRVGPVEMKR